MLLYAIYLYIIADSKWRQTLKYGQQLYSGKNWLQLRSIFRSSVYDKFSVLWRLFGQHQCGFYSHVCIQNKSDCTDYTEDKVYVLFTNNRNQNNMNSFPNLIFVLGCSYQINKRPPIWDGLYQIKHITNHVQHIFR